MAARVDKKELIIEKAIGIFAELGYYKATTAIVAKEAGVTQPYVFHFFKNKEELFKAVSDRAVKRIYEVFNHTEAPPEKLIETMGQAYTQLLQSHRDEIMMVMQAHAIAEPEIREHVKANFLMIHQLILEKLEQAGIPNAKKEASQFLGTGLLITVSEVLGLPQILCLDECEGR